APGNVHELRAALLAVVGARRRGFSDPFPWDRTVREYQGVLAGARRPAPWPVATRAADAARSGATGVSAASDLSPGALRRDDCARRARLAPDVERP
ncbi:MAG TPA: hypothetical protein VJY65_11140, partial [Chloroflexota bacterium]|nr:hypothetical protein [Chloroflexota bacterium]